MKFWTLENAGEEKTLAEWGVANLQITLRSQGTDSATFEALRQAFDAPLLFAKLSTITIRRDREQDPNTLAFSGGSVFYVGLMDKAQREATGTAETVIYNIAGLQWYFENLPFEQSHREYAGPAGTYTPAPGYVTDGTYDFYLMTNPAVVLNQDYYGNKITMAAQLKEILDFVIAAGAPIAYDSAEIDAEFGTQVLPTNERPDVTIAVALSTELAWIPDCETWFDYATSPPTYHIRRRSNLPNVTLDARGGDQIAELKIAERDELQCAQVVIKYRITNSVDGRAWVVFHTDKFPAVPADDSPFLKLRQSVDLTGFAGNNQVGEIQTEAIPADLTAPAAKSWWINRIPWLGAAGMTFTIANVTKAGSTLPNVLKDGTVAEWMTWNGDPVVAEDLTVSAIVKFSSTNASRKDERVSIQLKATNGQTAVYTKFAQTQLAEPIPTGLAEQIYNALAAPQFDGSFALIAQEVSSTIAVGKTISLSNGHADWATMAMPIKAINFDIQSGSTAVTFGVNRFLTAGERIDLMQITRNRVVTALTTSRANGGSSGGSSVVGGKNTPKETINMGAGLATKEIIMDEGKGQIQDGHYVLHSGALGMTEWRSAGVLPSAATSPENVPGVRLAVTEAQGTYIRLREIQGCDPTTGAKMYCMVLRSPWYPVNKTSTFAQ